MINVDVRDYTLEIDALHRNVWPVSFEGERVGQLTEHITVALDNSEPMKVDWSWKLFITVDGCENASVGSRARYATRDDALAQLAQVHHAIYLTGSDQRV